MDSKIITLDEVATIQVGQNLLQKFPEHKAICLFGELGTGKTRLVQGLGQSLGLKRIKSPTYVFRHDYSVEPPPFKKFSHFDLYRIQNYDDTLSLDLEGALNDPATLVALEWADRLGDFLPASRLEIHFTDLGENKRQLQFKSYPKSNE